MTLATATPTAHRRARIVLMKGHDADGFVWFTDRRSRKGADLAANPRAALVFHWEALGPSGARRGRGRRRSTTRRRGPTTATRPRGSQIGAWASHQSAAIASRAELEAAGGRRRGALRRRRPAVAAALGRLPPAPGAYEFWTHDDARLHDRIVYRRTAAGWARELLSP